MPRAITDYHTRLPNRLVDEWTRHIVRVLGAAHVVALVVVVRHSLGWPDEVREVTLDDGRRALVREIPLATIVRASGLGKARVCEILDDLETTGVIARIRGGAGRPTRIGIVADWRPTRDALAAGETIRRERNERKQTRTPTTPLSATVDRSEHENLSATVDSNLSATADNPPVRDGGQGQVSATVDTLKESTIGKSHVVESSDSRGGSMPGPTEKKSGEAQHASRGSAIGGSDHHHPNAPGLESVTGPGSRNGHGGDDDRLNPGQSMDGKPRRAKRASEVGGGAGSRKRGGKPWSSLPPSVGAVDVDDPGPEALEDAGRWAEILGVDDDAADAHRALASLAAHARQIGGEERIERVEPHLERIGEMYRSGRVTDIVAMLAEAVSRALDEPVSHEATSGPTPVPAPPKKRQKKQQAPEHIPLPPEKERILYEGLAERDEHELIFCIRKVHPIAAKLSGVHNAAYVAKRIIQLREDYPEVDARTVCSNFEIYWSDPKNVAKVARKTFAWNQRLAQFFRRAAASPYDSEKRQGSGASGGNPGGKKDPFEGLDPHADAAEYNMIVG